MGGGDFGGGGNFFFRSLFLRLLRKLFLLSLYTLRPSWRHTRRSFQSASKVTSQMQISKWDDKSAVFSPGNIFWTCFGFCDSLFFLEANVVSSQTKSLSSSALYRVFRAVPLIFLFLLKLSLLVIQPNV